MSFFSVLTLIFIVLKLCDVIMWSWWLVLLPFYGPVLLGFILVFVFGASISFLK